MPKTLEPGVLYVGRAPGVVNLNFTVPRDAAELIAEHASTRRSRGDFVARLVYEHVARIEERNRLKVKKGEHPDLA